ncbi:MAG: GNAT family N-acetyltransferase [Bdellovibrionota bacterium]
MEIKIAETNAEILFAYPVMKELRPHLVEEKFIEIIRLMAQEKYKLVCLLDPNVRAVAGIRLMETLATGKVLYVDDLVTSMEYRSKGYGKILLDWLIDTAKKQNCHFLKLDSGLKRTDAHRFYRRHGLEQIAHHFSIPTDGGPQWTSE